MEPTPYALRSIRYTEAVDGPTIARPVYRPHWSAIACAVVACFFFGVGLMAVIDLVAGR